MDTLNADDIKYLALSLLGRSDKPNFITSQEHDVLKINFIYPQVMYHTLQRYRWGFARKYIELQKVQMLSEAVIKTTLLCHLIFCI